MSCGPYSQPYQSACRQDLPYPQVSQESVPSLIDNLVTALYGSFYNPITGTGSIKKSVVNGRVVWNIPCDPNNTATINGIPRNSGEGLLCYIMRALNLTIPTNGFVTVDGIQTLTNKSIVSTGSTTARTLENRFADVVNVKDFGAKGDGVTDDTAAIQAAINSVSSGSYIEIVFPKGVYVVNGTVSFNGRIISWKRDIAASFTGTGYFNTVPIAPQPSGSNLYDQFPVRTNDRIFSGTALDANDGLMFNNTSADWLETEVPHTSSNGQVVSLSQAGQLAFVGGSKTSDVASGIVDSQGTMGVAGFVISDAIPPSGGNRTAYALYAEARRKGSAGWCHGFEVDAISRTGTISGSTAITTPLLSPQSPFNGPALVGGWFSNSRPDITDGGDASAGIALINNAGTRTATQGRYAVGILFDQKAILGADGSNYASGTNPGNAIALGVGHNIGWWNSNATTTPLTTVGSSDTGTLGGGLDFASGGAIFKQSDGARGFLVAKTAGAVNYLAAAPAVTGSGAILSAYTTGSDTAVDIRLSPFATAGSVTPYVDNTTSLGKSGMRWSSVWAANGTIQTSDEREKTEIANSSLGLDFINALRPVSYKFKVGGNVITETDENGLPTKVEPVAGERVHYGLLAQEVKAALPEGTDFGGWILTDKNDPNSEQGLRYEEFISPLIKAVQDLSAEVTALKAQLAGQTTSTSGL